MNRSTRPRWALFAAIVLTIAHLLLTAKGLRLQIPIYWLVPLAYGLCAFFDYDDPPLCMATCQLALSFAPVLLSSLFRAFAGSVQDEIYFIVHIIAFLLQATLRCVGLYGYAQRLNRPLYTAAMITTIIYTLSEIAFVLVLWFDGPHNTSPLNLSTKIGAAALALQLLQLSFLAIVALLPPPRIEPSRPAA